MEPRVYFWRILGGVWLVFLWLILTTPVVVTEDYGSFWPLWLEGYGDKLIHFGLFLVNGYFLDRLIQPRREGRSQAPVALVLALGLALGLATEWVQLGVEGRSGEVLDWIADGVGAGCYSVFSLGARLRFLDNEASEGLSSLGGGKGQW